MKTPVEPSQILFLPGALGRPQLWEPVANKLRHPAHKEHIGWPGFNSVPADPLVNGFDDLVAMVACRIKRETALVAQSMGGAIAIRLALEKPELITHLVLAATSGGVDVGRLGGQDWRPSFHASNPNLPHWFSTYQVDLSAQLSSINIPVLLLWGDSDPISPVGVGEYLESLLPSARLHIIEGGDHGFAESNAEQLSPLIDDFFMTGIGFNIQSAPPK